MVEEGGAALLNGEQAVAEENENKWRDGGGVVAWGMT